MIFVKIYVAIHMIMFLPNEEWNAQNPRPFPKNEYVLINWEKADFYHWEISNEYDLSFKVIDLKYYPYTNDLTNNIKKTIYNKSLLCVI